MAEVVVGQCHGGWSASDGFVAIPPGTYLYLFQQPGDLMDPSYADETALSLASALVAKQGKAAWKLEPGDIVYDYGTSPLTDNDYLDAFGNLDILQGPSAQGVTIVGGTEKLSDVLRANKGNNIYWLACQAYAGVPSNEEDELEQYGRLLTDAEKAEKSEEELKAMLDESQVKQV